MNNSASTCVKEYSASPEKEIPDDGGIETRILMNKEFTPLNTISNERSLSQATQRFDGTKPIASSLSEFPTIPSDFPSRSTLPDP